MDTEKLHVAPEQDVTSAGGAVVVVVGAVVDVVEDVVDVGGTVEGGVLVEGEVLGGPPESPGSPMFVACSPKLSSVPFWDASSPAMMATATSANTTAYSAMLRHDLGQRVERRYWMRRTLNGPPR